MFIFLEPLKTSNDRVFLEKNMKKILVRAPNNFVSHRLLCDKYVASARQHDDDSGLSRKKKCAKTLPTNLKESRLVAAPRTVSGHGALGGSDPQACRGGSLRYVEVR